MVEKASSAPVLDPSAPREAWVRDAGEGFGKRKALAAEHRVWVAGVVCWVPDERRAFVEARVVEVKDGSATVSVEADGDEPELRQCPLQELLPRVVGLSCVSNMDDLPELNKATVLQNVEMLFYHLQSAVPGVGQTAIYSSVGPVLIAMNPFTELPIYGPEWIAAYSSAGGGAQSAAQKRLGPHCYATAEEAYQGLRAIRHQSVVICGESGAGKTVTNKKMLQYLCEVGRDAEGQSGADPEQIIEANVLLEAFGNAKTTRNNNSSRFGKFTQVCFDTERYTVEGCEIEHYLLERSRVVAQGRWERNYHIFYQLSRSAEAAKYGLSGGPEAFEYTKSGAAEEGFDDSRDFEELCVGMSKAGFSAEAQQDIFEAAASVLHLGNVAFEGDADKSQVRPETVGALSKACKLLGIELEALSTALTTRITKVGGQDIQRHLSAEKAKAQCQAVAKMVYSRLFDRIVRSLNARLSRRIPMETMSGSATVGLLDIFGFEDMLINGFEQMLINLTNERIQHLFNSIMFERELEAYQKEGITDAFEDIPSNMKCIQLFCQAKPPGILKLLTDQCMTRGEDGDGIRFVDVLNRNLKHQVHYKTCTPQNFREVTNQKISAADRKLMPKRNYNECFFVEHYAGSVMYTVQEFVSKSRDTLLPHLAEVLRQSSKQSLQQMFPPGAQGASGALRGGAKESTVGEKFLKQLELLAGSLERGACLFVRCIKSNPKMLPGRVHRPLVMEQLTCSGIVAALEMRNRGFPDRIEFRAFCNEFFVLEDRHATQLEAVQRCQLIMRDFIDISIGEECTAPYAFGHTKVFMKGNVLPILRAIKEVKLRRFANLVRQRWRIYHGTERIKHVEESWEHFQAIRASACEQGVHELASVSSELRECEALISPVYASLKKARELHGNDVPKIGAALNRHIQELPKFRSKVDVAAARIEELAARKQLLDQLLLMRLRRAAEDADGFAERLTAVEKECASQEEGAADAAEREECCGVCKSARSKLEILCKTEVPEAHRLGSVGLGLDLESEDITAMSEDLVPRITELLQEISAEAEKAEKLAHSISRVRQEFLRAAAESKERIAAARATLKELQEESRQYITEGYNGIGEVFDDAWREHDTLEELQELAEDRDQFLASVASFEESVGIAKSQINKCRQWLSRHREAELSKLSSVLTQLTGHEDLLRASALCVRAAKTGREELQKKLASKAAGKSPTEEKVLQGLQQVEEMLRGLGLAEMSEEEVEQLRIVDRSDATAAGVEEMPAGEAAARGPWYRFGWPAKASDPEMPTRNTQLLRTIANAPDEKGTWDVSQTARVGRRDVERGSVKVMDKEAVPSVSAAVEALQLGILQCPEGYVVVWSKRAGQPFVVYRSDKRREAFDHFNLNEDKSRRSDVSTEDEAPTNWYNWR